MPRSPRPSTASARAPAVPRRMARLSYLHLLGTSVSPLAFNLSSSRTTAMAVQASAAARLAVARSSAVHRGPSRGPGRRARAAAVAVATATGTRRGQSVGTG